ncbi:MAG: hypothetical protein NTY38_11610, partial [Acidobacteria bacterium]|nr:hypothetical protein [Acidobacteriota bacterium]
MSEEQTPAIQHEEHAMKPACPSCGSTNFRASHPQSLWESLRGVLGIVPIRCRECQTRYEGRLFRPLDVVYARCPRCFRLDLSMWTLDHYNVGIWQRIKLGFGAHPWRCEACRCNFASFRRRKRRFRSHRQARQVPPKTAGSDE